MEILIQECGHIPRFERRLGKHIKNYCKVPCMWYQINLYWCVHVETTNKPENVGFGTHIHVSCLKSGHNGRLIPFDSVDLQVPLNEEIV